MEDNFMYARGRSGGGLVCTAKEVYLDAIQIKDRSTCNSGDDATVSIHADIIFNAARYDVGWYIATDVRVSFRHLFGALLRSYC
jgi:hypothetical protein